MIKLRHLIPVAALALAGGTIALTQTAFAAPAPTPTPTPAMTVTTAAAVPAAVTADGSRAVIAFYTLLTGPQQQCLAEAGLQRPEGKLDATQQAELRSAIDKALADCGITVPERLAGFDRLGFGYASLSPEQQQCLAAAELTRPVGRLTPEQRLAVRQAKLDAAAACGVGR